MRRLTCETCGNTEDFKVITTQTRVDLFKVSSQRATFESMHVHEVQFECAKEGCAFPTAVLEEEEQD